MAPAFFKDIHHILTPIKSFKIQKIKQYALNKYIKRRQWHIHRGEEV